MTSRQAANEGLPHNIRRIDTREKNFNGMQMLMHEVWFDEGEVCFPLGDDDATRVTIMMEEYGGFGEARISRRTPCPVDHRLPNAMMYAPAGQWVWGYSAQHQYTRDLVACFDVGALAERLEHHVAQSAIEEPRLRFNNPKLWSLAKMLEDLPDNDDSYRLFGDSITAAMFALLFVNRETVAQSGKLANWQLKRVIEYMRERLPDPVQLSELASLVGLSQWHFARAFKMSTGKSPYQYQLETRVQEAKLLLIRTDLTVQAIASATGFSDSMHFIRTFKKRVGATPAAWRRETSPT